jgi:murein DD-endopeptidase MepM/ murein hydrolase activator NlpD
VQITIAAAVLSAVLSSNRVDEVSVTASARSIQPGEVVVLTVRTVKPADSLIVRALNSQFEPFAITVTTWRVLIGIDLAVKPGQHDVLIETRPDARMASYRLVVKPRRFPRRILKVDPVFVTPPPEAVERIERETMELNQVWKSSAPEKLWHGAFIRPVPQAANSAFGTHSIFNGEPRSQHSGADFRSPAGTPIKAPNSGQVVLAGSRYFSGDTVVIDHGQGLFSLFAHLSMTNVKQGESVTKGVVIGRVGATGRVTGPHLHWAVRVNGARVDPLSLLTVLARLERPVQKPRGRTQKLSSQVAPGGMLCSSL